MLLTGMHEREIQFKNAGDRLPGFLWGDELRRVSHCLESGADELAFRAALFGVRDHGPYHVPSIGLRPLASAFARILHAIATLEIDSPF